MGKKNRKVIIGLDVQIAEELYKAIDDLTLFDDDLMSKVFDGNNEATELLLMIILERDDIKVIRVRGQVEMKNPLSGGRNIRIDIHAIDGAGNEFDVEVQRGEEGAHPRRARFNGSMLDSRMLKKKQPFKETKEGRGIMCESFSILADKVADKREEKTKADIVKALMENMKWTLEQALTASGIQGKDRAVIAKQLQN